MLRRVSWVYNKVMRPAALQIVAEFDECSFDLLCDSENLRLILESCITRAGFHLVQTYIHEYTAQAVTVVSVISESHVVLHTYPEASHISVDIFTCAAEIERPKQLLNLLKESFRPTNSRMKIIERGDVLEVQSPGRICISRSDSIDLSMQVSEVLYSGASEYQKIEIAISDQFGKLLVLDRHLQVAESDLELYHNALFSGVSEDRFYSSNTLVLGGGDGGVAAYVARKDPNLIDVVDADQKVADLCQQYFPECSAGVFEQPHVSLYAQDVLEFLDCCDRYDNIVYDLTLHPESFTREPRQQYLGNVFTLIRLRLGPGGFLHMQCCSEFDLVTQEMVRELLEKHFEDVVYRHVYIPSFACRWLFATAVVQAIV